MNLGGGGVRVGAVLLRKKVRSTHHYLRGVSP